MLFSWANSKKAFIFENEQSAGTGSLVMSPGGSDVALVEVAAVGMAAMIKRQSK